MKLQIRQDQAGLTPVFRLVMISSLRMGDQRRCNQDQQTEKANRDERNPADARAPP